MKKRMENPLFFLIIVFFLFYKFILSVLRMLVTMRDAGWNLKHRMMVLLLCFISMVLKNSGGGKRVNGGRTGGKDQAGKKRFFCIGS